MLQIFDISSNYFNGTLPLDFFKKLKAMMHSDSNLSTLRFEYKKSSPSCYQNAVTVKSEGLVMTLVRLLAKVFMSLYFSNNHFEGNIPAVIGQLQGLHALNLSYNSFIGKVPASVGNLKQLESLGLSTNSLYGEIPQEMTSLTCLSYLNLSHNYFSEQIPQSNQFSTFPNTSFWRKSVVTWEPVIEEMQRREGKWD
ncbi:uncharacterized protein A4U43_C07F5730 [Asparagus officinalis]|uniref:Leucine-rich repeat-containing N-terminal plant-type domain-containing protein n=2 Tax=Asparagus officinalis TaxID=4686 RepID=A0A5P1E9U3_ASPOF|nr:uncharacterized protein A4U43_C07F5730 [Asparagus officinalis]